MPLAQKTSSDFEEDFDRKALKSLKARFLQINQGRLERTRKGLSNHQQVFLSSLPMLLHVNHPLLPGYISANTPCGLSQYVPDKDSIRTIKKSARSFEYKHGASNDFNIYSIFLMGSTGTVAHSGASDMDIWIVHNPDLSQKQMSELRLKLNAIQEWAETLSLDVFFFLMDFAKFREGVRNEIGEEDCGSAQHFLLLDEFYRTGLLLAGRFPLWWLIPANKEADYTELANMLLEKQYIQEDEIVDFGGIAHIPPGEFIGAGMWQLYKGIDSPFKSVLKILLTEVYASEYPNVEALCLRFKQKVYDGETELDELDPYVMVYRRLEEYLLKKQDLGRLELVRRCLYIKVNLHVTKPSHKMGQSWRRLLMEKITTDWKWEAKTLLTLDSRKKWKIHRVLAERKALVNELNYSYRFLSSFAKANRSYALINQQDMNILGRKLYAAFERKSGKIEKINPKIAPDISEDYLSLFFHSGAWVIYPGQHKSEQPAKVEPIKRTGSVIEVLAWCFFNKILEKSTRLVLNSNDSGLTDAELRKIIICFARLYPKRHIAAEQQAFSSKARDEKLTLLINIGIDPMKSMSNKGVQRISTNTDALRYSGLQTNLVLSVDQISVNTWKEVITTQFCGENAVIDCILQFLRSNPPSKQKPPPELNILCFCATKADTIIQRIEALFRSIIKCFYSHSGAEYNRYIVEIGNAFYVIQIQDKLPCVKKLRNYGSLIRYLSQAQNNYSHIVLDDKALEGSTLAVVNQNDISDVVQVFYMPRNKTASNSQADVFILDERGSLFSYTTTFNDEKTFIPPMFRFIQSALNRQNSELVEDETERQCEHIMFYEIMAAKKELPIHAVNKGILKRLDADKFYNVQAIVEHSKKGEVLYTIFCNHKEFSQLEHGSKIFEMAAQYILSMRPSQSRYPIYITDLDLSNSNTQGEKTKRLQISQYIAQKQMIESRLNEALFKL